MNEKPKTFGELKKSPWGNPALQKRTVKDEMRVNLIGKLERGEALFPGIVGYEDSVIPQIINAVLSRHNMILLGLRGQAKSRILRSLVGLLDPEIPVVAGCELNDNPFAPVCRYCRTLLREKGDDTPIALFPRTERYVEKLATPDVTIADMIGDVDPIRAARGGLNLSDELTMHYGLLPRANRGIFAINELPDLAGKIQVGLFNILQEGDIQIKGFPIRLSLDVAIVFTANPEDYTARGKIITPLKDRIGSEIRTHYPATLDEGIAITEQEAWVERQLGNRLSIPRYIKEVIEGVAFQARQDKRVDKRSGVSQRLPITVLENVVSNAERRALLHREKKVVPRIADLYAAIPSMTGKLELEYEGELKGAENVALELIRASIRESFLRTSEGADLQQIVDWFELGGCLKLTDMAPATEVLRQLGMIQGLTEKLALLGVQKKDDVAFQVSAGEFILEGLCAMQKISRSEEKGFVATEKKRVEAYFDEKPGRSRKSFN
ncbi:MAG: magnesium chelatase [Terriglobia bacterium]